MPTPPRAATATPPPEPPVAKPTAPPAFQLPRYIAVEGPIRVGKSSLARILAERMHARRVNDCDEENPFLSDFYAEKAGAAFAAQMYFLNERYQRLRDTFAVERSGIGTGPVVADFIFEKDKIFAYLNLDNEELKLYDRYLHAICCRTSAAGTGHLPASHSRSAARARVQESGRQRIAHFPRIH